MICPYCDFDDPDEMDPGATITLVDINGDEAGEVVLWHCSQCGGDFVSEGTANGEASRLEPGGSPQG